MLLKLTAKLSDDYKYFCPTASANSAWRADTATILTSPHSTPLDCHPPKYNLSVPSPTQQHKRALTWFWLTALRKWTTALKNSYLGKRLTRKIAFLFTTACHISFSNFSFPPPPPCHLRFPGPMRLDDTNSICIKKARRGGYSFFQGSRNNPVNYYSSNTYTLFPSGQLPLLVNQIAI